VIHAYKYAGVRDLSEPLSALIINSLLLLDSAGLNTILEHLRGSTVIPVPLHRKRLLERGYNQASLLAAPIAKFLSGTVNESMLKRSRETEIQAKLKKKERKRNVQGAFTVRKAFKDTIKNVILVDDVTTTLSTLNECAGALKTAGCQKIWGIVIARGS
jgi:ComF family protein